MKKVVLVLFASLLLFAGIAQAQELDELLDHFVQLREFSGTSDLNITGVVVTDEYLVTISASHYIVRSLAGDYEVASSSIPTELTGVYDLDTDGEYIYGVNQYGQRSRVYRWSVLDINSFELVTEEGTHYQALAVDPATKDIYIIDEQPSYMQKLRYNQATDDYSSITLGATGLWQPKGLAWFPEAPNGRNLVVSRWTDNDDNDEYEMTVLFIDPENISSHSAEYMLYGDASADGGAARGISTTWTYDPGQYLLATVTEGVGIDLWELGAIEGTSDLTVSVQNMLSWANVEGATVEVLNSANEVEVSGTTDSDGDCYFDALSVGLKTVHVTTEEFTLGIAEGVRVLATTGNEVSIMLLPEGGGYQVAGNNDDFYNLSGQERLDMPTDGIVAVTLNEPFQFYGEFYETMYVGENGALSFTENTAIPATPGVIPSTDGPNNIIAGYWTDLTSGSETQGVRVYYPGGEHKTVIQWYLNDVSGNYVQFQITLYHSYNKIGCMYVTGDFAATDAVVGIENADGTAGTPYTYGANVDYDWSMIWMVNDIDEQTTVTIPASYTLSEVYPNPFNPTATARVELAAPGQLRVVLFNMLGRQVAEIAQGNFSAGSHNFVIDGRQLSSGVYFVNTSIPGTFNQTRRVVLLK